MKLYKFLLTGMKSNSGDHTWELKKWYKVENIEICSRGFHASARPIDAFSYLVGEILAVVETRGEHIDQLDKQCWSEMRVVKAYHWKKEDSVSLAIFAAELVIKIFEKKYPNDDRPRKAIEAAKAYLGAPSVKTARAAYDAARAADDYDAYDAVRAVASYAAYAAASTVAYAYTAVYVAADAHSGALGKTNKWMLARIKQLEEIV